MLITFKTRLAAAVFAVFATVGCESIPIDIGTPEPIIVDIEMRLDVYQYGDAEDKETADMIKVEEVVERQSNRSAEIQELKNNRLVGESHFGTLLLRTPPAGEYGEYVKKTVEAENQDRVFLMRFNAKEEDKHYYEIQKEEWKSRVERSFPGEWIEVEGEKPNTYEWIQKPDPNA